MTGTVYLVGAGPGAADLLTLRAARLLAEADVVLHDALVHPDVLALAKGAKLYNVGKRANLPSVEQRFICRLLVRMAERHEIVARIQSHLHEYPVTADKERLFEKLALGAPLAG